jgi:CRISPR-associated protein Cas2
MPASSIKVTACRGPRRSPWRQGIRRYLPAYEKELATPFSIDGEALTFRQLLRRQAERLQRMLTSRLAVQELPLAVLIVASYDVPNDRRQTRLADALRDFGERVQLSVFECLPEAADLDRLRERLLCEIELSEDSDRIYRLCETWRAKVEPTAGLNAVNPTTRISCQPQFAILADRLHLNLQAQQ